MNDESRHHEPVQDRHHRQRLLPMVGDAGQDRLRCAHGVIVGCGALGSAVAESLCRAGVGTLTIIDRDVVELTNLQRQTLFTEEHAREGLPKAIAAQRTLAQIDPNIVVHAHVDDLNPDTADRLIPPAESRCEGVGIHHGDPSLALGALKESTKSDSTISVLIDGTDNFETRFLLNDLAVHHGVPLVYAGVVGTTGLITTVLPERTSETPKDSRSSDFWNPTACLRCLFDEAPPAGSAPTCDTAGVLGAAVSIIAGFQTVEAMKILLGRFDDVNRSLLEVDAWSGAVRRIDTSSARLDDCECCALRHFDYLDGAHASQTVSLCGKNAVQISPAYETNIDLDALKIRLTPHGRFISNGLLLRGLFTDERGEQGDPIEMMLFPTGRAIIKGTADPARARSLYARYLGV